MMPYDSGDPEMAEEMEDLMALACHLVGEKGLGQHVLIVLHEPSEGIGKIEARGFFREDDAVVEVSRLQRRVSNIAKVMPLLERVMKKEVIARLGRSTPHVMLWYGEKPGQWTLWEEHGHQWPYQRTVKYDGREYA